MPEHNHKYTFRFKDKKVVFNKLAHETEFHPFAKALAFALYHKEYPTIRVEAKVDERFQPDLNALGFDGAMIFWAEVGNVSINKVEKLFKKYRQAHFVNECATYGAKRHKSQHELIPTAFLRKRSSGDKFAPITYASFGRVSYVLI